MIGVPSPILWGILAAVLRFVPYIGAFISAAFTDKLWSVEDIVALVEAAEPKPAKRGPYKKRVAA
jgi:hypothetical protein